VTNVAFSYPQARRFENPELIERCRKFWRREAVDRPLVGVLFDRMFPLQTFASGRENAEVLPEDVSVGWFLGECERRHLASEEIGGDAVFVAYAGIGLPWIEAVLGLKVRVQGGGGWAEPLDSDWKTYGEDSVRWDNGWFEKMQELTAAAVNAGQGRFSVGPCHLRSPIDLASAILGAEALCLSIYDDPDALRRLLDIFSDVWSKMVEAQYERLPAYFDGYWCGNQPIWAPGRTMFVTADAASLFSPRTFRQWVVPYLERIVQGLDYCIMHTHSTYLHMLDAVMDIEGLRAIQVGIDDTGNKDISPLIPTLQRVQAGKALILAVTEKDPAIAASQAQMALRELSPQGLCVLAYLPTVEAGKLFLKSVEESSAM